MGADELKLFETLNHAISLIKDEELMNEAYNLTNSLNKIFVKNDFAREFMTEADVAEWLKMSIREVRLVLSQPGCPLPLRSMDGSVWAMNLYSKSQLYDYVVDGIILDGPIQAIQTKGLNNRYFKHSYVYLLAHSEKPIFKIGKANDVPARVRKIGMSRSVGERTCAFGVRAEKGALALEGFMHFTYSDHRLSGVSDKDGGTEWFDIECMDDAIFTLNHLAELGKVTERLSYDEMFSR